MCAYIPSHGADPSTQIFIRGHPSIACEAAPHFVMHCLLHVDIYELVENTFIMLLYFMHAVLSIFQAIRTITFSAALYLSMSYFISFIIRSLGVLLSRILFMSYTAGARRLIIIYIYQSAQR